MNKVNLQELFNGLQDELKSKLNLSKMIDHPTAKGDDTELNWSDVLKKLPSRYEIGKGFVIDSKGNLSDQIDIIVYDHYYSPLILHRDSLLYIPAESVYAVLEVKQSLSKEFVEYAGSKAKSVRDLIRTSAPVKQIDGSLKRREFLPPILAGILTYDSDWNPPFGDSFKKSLNGLDLSSRLNLGISLKHGSFNCSYSENSDLLLNISKPETSLISFFINLTKQLQLLGNAPGIDLDEYYKCY